MSFDPFDGEGWNKKFFGKFGKNFKNLILTSRSYADNRGIMQNPFRTKTQISFGFKIENDFPRTKNFRGLVRIFDVKIF